MTQKKTDTCRRYSTQQETLYAIEERRKINKDAADVVPMTAWETREGGYWGSQERHEACTMTRRPHKEGHLQQTGQGQECIKRNEQQLEICRVNCQHQAETTRDVHMLHQLSYLDLNAGEWLRLISANYDFSTPHVSGEYSEHSGKRRFPMRT